MPIYQYTALKSGKEIVNGTINAESLREAREFLRNKDLMPTKIEEVKNKTTSQSSTVNKAEAKKRDIALKSIGLRDKIEFTNTLSIFVRTGISIIEGLLFIEKHYYNAKVQKLASELRKSIFTGANLSSTVRKYPKIFDMVYCGLIRAGEESGQLDIILVKLVEILERQNKIKSKVIGTMVYPCFIIILAIIVTLVMLTFVFPAFKDMYTQMGQQLPWITQVLMDLGVFLRTYWFSIPLLMGGIGYTAYLFLTLPSLTIILDRFFLRLPLINDFVKFAALANFMSVFKVSFDAGVPIVDCLSLANQTMKNLELRKAMKEASVKIQNGQSLSNSLNATGLIPGIIMCLIMTGEESGQLSFTMEQATIYMETELDRVIDIINKLSEPLLIVIIGAVVLVLALALYLPLFQSYSNML